MSSCKIVKFSNVKYIHTVMQPVPRTFSFCRIETLYLLNNSPFSLLSGP